IPDNERIVTIEDAAELQLAQRHVLRLESRPKNIEGEGEITIRDLVRNSLRMRPDRIVVGEVRGAEAVDMLQAMNTEHDGSLSTLHANSPRDALARLETMVLMSGFDLPLRAIREQITSAVDLLLHLERMHDGTRRVGAGVATLALFAGPAVAIAIKPSGSESQAPSTATTKTPATTTTAPATRTATITTTVTTTQVPSASTPTTPTKKPKAPKKPNKPKPIPPLAASIAGSGPFPWRTLLLPGPFKKPLSLSAVHVTENGNAVGGATLSALSAPT